MIDALLFSVRDAVRGGNFGYGADQCDIMPEGHPRPATGDVFVAIHEGSETSTMDNALDDYFDFSLTLTMRTTNVSFDRIGDQMLASKLARRAGPGGAPSFNARCEQLRAFLHMNWAVIGVANDYLVAWAIDGTTVYGFAEPARFRQREVPQLVGGEWFAADPEAEDTGLKSELRFEGARRLQPIASYF